MVVRLQFVTSVCSFSTKFHLIKRRLFYRRQFPCNKTARNSRKEPKTCAEIYENYFAQVVAQINKPTANTRERERESRRKLSWPEAVTVTATKRKVFVWKEFGWEEWEGGEGVKEVVWCGDQQTNHNNHTEIKLIKMRGPLARQATFKNINKN